MGDVDPGWVGLGLLWAMLGGVLARYWLRALRARRLRELHRELPPKWRPQA